MVRFFFVFEKDAPGNVGSSSISLGQHDDNERRVGNSKSGDEFTVTDYLFHY